MTLIIILNTYLYSSHYFRLLLNCHKLLVIEIVIVVTLDILVLHRRQLNKETSIFFTRLVIVFVESFVLMLVCLSEVVLGVGLCCRHW